MIFLAFTAALACASMIWLGFFVLLKNPRSPLNRVFFCYCATGAMGAYAGFNSLLAGHYEEVIFWSDVHLAFWPFLLPFQLHFILLFTGKERVAAKKSVLAGMYLPALAQSFLGTATDYIQRLPVRNDWGWSVGAPQGGAMITMVNVWVLVMAILPLYLLFRYVFEQKNSEVKRQAACVCVGLFSYMLWGVLSQGVLPRIGVHIPSMISVAVLIAAGCYGYAVLRHGLFSLSPITAAEEIVYTMSDALLLVGTDKHIHAMGRTVVRRGSEQGR